ncbi:phage baseplate assembly protein V [Komagataeibacter rhaeticus]|nr:phage baseplate assembly protein V [Komagataeibacter rhaeticus]
MADTRMLAANMANAQAQPGFGLVSAVDPVNHAVKVTAQPAGVESGWLPHAAMQVGSLRIACPPDIGAHVLLVRLEGDGEHAVCACPVYDTVVMPPLSPATGRPAQPGRCWSWPAAARPRECWRGGGPAGRKRAVVAHHQGHDLQRGRKHHRDPDQWFPRVEGRRCIHDAGRERTGRDRRRDHD